jgi:uncharacterized protein YecE (DUF72 family)
MIEIAETFLQPPKPATARSWRAQAPDGFVFAVRAWQLITHEPSAETYARLAKPVPKNAADRYGGFRDTDEVAAAWQSTTEICDALGARAVLFETPASFTPTQTHRERMIRFFRQLPRKGMVVAWEPRGVWEPREVAALCAELDLVHVVDPLQLPTTTRGQAYYRLHGLGGFGGEYGELELEKLLVACDGFDESFVVFDNVKRAQDATRFAALVMRESG